MNDALLDNLRLSAKAESIVTKSILEASPVGVSKPLRAVNQFVRNPREEEATDSARKSKLKKHLMTLASSGDADRIIHELNQVASEASFPVNSMYKLLNTSFNQIVKDVRSKFTEISVDDFSAYMKDAAEKIIQANENSSDRQSDFAVPRPVSSSPPDPEPSEEEEAKPVAVAEARAATRTLNELIDKLHGLDNRKVNEIIKKTVKYEDDNPNTITLDAYETLQKYSGVGEYTKGDHVKLKKQLIQQFVAPTIVAYEQSRIKQDSSLSANQIADESRAAFGLGLKKTEVNFIPFGNILLDYNALNHRQQLKVRRQSMATIAELPITSVSREFASTVDDLLHEKFVGKRLSKLDRDELELLHLLMNKAKLHKEISEYDALQTFSKSTRKRHPASHPVTVGSGGLTNSIAHKKRDRDRWEVVWGEIEAGNDNPAILKEAFALLDRFSVNGLIEKKQYDDYMTELRDRRSN